METLTLFSTMLTTKEYQNIGDMELPVLKLICKSPAYTGRPKITASKDGYALFMKYWEPDTISYNERMLMIPINRNNEMLGVIEISVGGQSGCAVDPKMVFQAALLCGAAGFLLAHNHPSGNRNPSTADISLTKKISVVCEAMGIKLLDHLIVIPHSTNYYSFADEGLL